MQPARPIYRVKEVVESISEVYIALATLAGTVVAPTQPYFLPLRARAAAAVLSFTRFFFPSLGEQTLLCVSYHYWLLVPASTSTSTCLFPIFFNEEAWFLS